MTTLINSVTYQGYACKSVRWKRSDGLTPELGSVTLDYSVIKDLKLQSDAVPWRGDDGGADVMGPMGISSWFELFFKKPGTRTADKPFSAPGSGLKLYGPLIMTTTTDGGGAESVRYDDIYVINAEEVSENLARVREHNEGEIRIDLSDIRQFYGKYGAIIGRINCRLESGKYDPRTIKVPGRKVGRGGTTTAGELEGTPWSFEEVINYLFSQLPGGPSVNLTGLKGLPPPEEIDHLGSPTSTVIQGVLDNYGLVAKMQPNGTYFVAKKRDSFIKRGQAAAGINKAVTPAHVAYEVKSATRIDVPAVVMVVGGNRYRGQTQGYVPAFKDIDGKLYQLSDVAKVFDGYTLERVNRHAARTPSKSFQDVPPKPFKRQFSEEELKSIVTSRRGIPGTKEGDAQDQLHYARRRILREQAYRLYAPLLLFMGDAPKNAKGAPYFTDGDDRAFGFLPMGTVPKFEGEQADLIHRARKVPGDKGRVILAPPIVRGAMLEEALFTDNGEIAAQHDSVMRGWFLCLKTAEDQLEKAKERGAHFDQEAARANDLIQVGQFIESGLVNSFNRGIFGRGDMYSERFIERGMAASKYIAGQKALLLLEIVGFEGSGGLEGRINKIKSKIKELENAKAQDLAALAVAGGVQGVGQVPFGVIPEENYNLDGATGILRFSKPVCMVDHPLVFDQEDLTVIFDGMVSVTFGHPVDNNDPSDLTSILFCSDGKGGSKLCGANRPSAIKPHVVRDPDMVMYEDELGDPMNLKDCISQAEKKAKPILEGPGATESFVTEFSGFVPCVLERGINSVQFIWPAQHPGGGVAHTYVAVHSPGWIGPVGAAETSKLIDRDGPARVAAKQES